MARAIYSLKKFLVRSQLQILITHENASRDISIFIVNVYVKLWFEYNAAVKAPNHNFCFLKAVKLYEKVDPTISRVAVKKFNQHLWNLSGGLSVLSIIDDDVDVNKKIKMVASLDRENLHMEERYIPLYEELNAKLFGKLNFIFL